ncbi:hypothetical protein DDB_G0282861 [Dictyostelium discoideum AX4]|uniref:Translationally-controlled tumor protein homolog 2 n=1 Tax=Dictyostelium discoideum TaxID=44689 RepID=TCTP2_DICDI|nr:hypothetical protein DDB_G0282861 [Dictyostelium discoideum AX4]Q54RX1.1 RecName: Full=Translationally-controlled tumor protein homolog 2; Short=TCTP 2 [Dictyostelium discoideum]EAL66010.1 hypothetical protein DDB_G0282861 [Dictyostelium discoideum AX4]|eukprot:XP_639366.1 hypothetical protein DDB_G0282861 [Dictyostelium discoideum AX4]
MKLYKDLIGNSHDDLLTDRYEIKVGDVTFEVKTKMITKDLNVVVNNNSLGGSISTTVDNNNSITLSTNLEDEFENVEAAGTFQINNLVEQLRLVETSFDKKSYLAYMKLYIKDLINHIKQQPSNSDNEKIEHIQKGIQSFVKTMMDGENFKKYSFFTGSSMDANGLVALMYYKDDDPTTPTFVFIKYGLLQVDV